MRVEAAARDERWAVQVRACLWAVRRASCDMKHVTVAAWVW